jgi:hypothetical protein
VSILEHVTDERKRGGCEGCSGNSQYRARHDEHLDARRECSQQGGHPKRRSSDQQQTPATYPVTERAHRDQHAGHHETVDVDDPQQLRARGFQVGAQRRHGEIQHHEVHRVQQAGQRDHG